jgi:hypothetical protein
MAIVNLAHRPALSGQSVRSADDLVPTEAEVYYLWSYIQGSIMIPETRQRLRRAWGMCERHAFIAIAVECAHRHTFLHGPTILYHDLMGGAVAAFRVSGPFKTLQIARRLEDAGPCLMCELGYDANKAVRTSLPGYILAGNDLANIRALASETEAYWRPAMCGECAGTGTGRLCRLHLRERLGQRDVDVTEQQALVEYISQHITNYHLSFWWDHRDTDTTEDRAALISAIGWCSGWRPWLVLSPEH